MRETSMHIVDDRCAPDNPYNACDRIANKFSKRDNVSLQSEPDIGYSVRRFV
ncbi:hypothetical protein Poly51_62500 [Rubripirellula tenax]|uniref:Uncharacterized protein n=1 Tax=Rubripirellula tenax TaxID=2528015 RepID=A0A5C6E8S7_9BACT|nr:hypothetical protein Poly51_62500 [Rubripirellula tenax]